ncbi:MAG TPA: endonuclease domain-containing protein [Allosphingosinicella sp.]|nr:endonuclease domain-containing protein [Allosphingosinicella sp.]
MALRINAKLGEHARRMRNEPTEPEKRLWARLRNSQLEGFKFRRQTVIGPYICDFFCSAKGLVVELDGDTHDAQADAKRDQALARQGFTVLRFTNREIGENLDGVIEAILLKVRALPDRFTHPLTPSLEREGEI